ncbi:MAG: cytochrome c3 family protein [Bacteroidales bacterium]|nr:cytochrome c3 family protein [Bacteroidales bacterium]
MKKITRILLSIFLAFSAGTMAQSDSATSDLNLDAYRQVNDFVDENESCFECHANTKYVLIDEFFGREIMQSMCKDKIVTRDEYYSMVHNSFACLDCHAYEYEEFPHPLEARLEQPYQCIDCHGYDENYAHFRFEDIEMEYMESVHAKGIENFSCWKCHDPHAYKLTIGADGTSISDGIAYNNDICLSCHSDFSRFELLTEREEINILETHDWLPNQATHFGSVRCIECHTSISDSTFVAHHVLSSDKAVKKCAECHSKNSILMASLYKHEAKESRRRYGFINGVILNEAYVIGANRNTFLSTIGIILFLATLGGVSIHIIARIIYKK